MKITDSHAHYDSDAFDPDRYELLDRLFMGDIGTIINVGCSIKGSRNSAALAERYAKMYFTAGLHPDAAGEVSQIDVIAQLCRHEKCVAVGEAGLDYHYEYFSREAQKKAFEAQLALARDMGLPVVVHSRDACEDTMAILRKYRPRGVMHCFSYSAEVAAEAVKMGMYIGFTGAVTFKNAVKLRKVVKSVPADRLLCETDCPYMAPEPMRGKRCDSSMLIRTLTYFGELRGISVGEAAEITRNNAAELFGKIK